MGDPLGEVMDRLEDDAELQQQGTYVLEYASRCD